MATVRGFGNNRLLSDYSPGAGTVNQSAFGNGMCAFVSEDKQRGLVHAACVPFSSVISSDSVVVRTDDATRLKNLGIESRLVLPRGSAGHNDCLFVGRRFPSNMA